MSSDDEITKKILNPNFDSEAPTKKTAVLPPRCASHDREILCECVCHRYTTIYHQHACCLICPECAFRRKLFADESVSEGEG